MLKNFNGNSWLNEFEEENFSTDTFVNISEDIIEDSYGAFNKFYRKESKKEKSIAKRKPAWQ